MTHLVTAAFLIHTYLVVSTVLGGAHTANPIWGELRSAAAAVPLVPIWVVIQGAC